MRPGVRSPWGKKQKDTESHRTNEVRISHVEGIWTPASKVDPFPDTAATRLDSHFPEKKQPIKPRRDVKKAAQFVAAFF